MLMLRTWKKISNGATLGPIQLLEDGAVVIGDSTFDASVELQSCQFAGALITKRGQRMKIVTPHDGTYRFKYRNGSWFSDR